MRKPNRKTVWVLGLCLFLLPRPPAQALTNVVRVGTYFFNPTNLTVVIGDTVKWTNSSNIPHDTTHNSSTPLWGRPAADMAGPGGTFSFTFINLGFFPYVCAQHIATFRQQTGSVTVASANMTPTVAITNPPNGTSFGRPVNLRIQAAASDSDGTVTQVQFFANAILVGTDVTSPFEVMANSTTLLAGQYAITARATDNRGTLATSAPVNITLTQPAGGMTNIVTVGSFFFSPQLLTINAGDSVIWSNSVVMAHTATGRAGSSEALCGTVNLSLGGIRCTNKFMTEGTFPYFCNIHPTLMMGTVVVVRPLILSDPRFTPEGHFRFDYNAIPGQKYVIRRSGVDGSVLPQVPFATNMATNTVVTVTDGNVGRARAYTVGREP